MDSVSQARLSLIHPLLASKIAQLDSILQAEGITIRVTQALRSWTEQDKLFAQGRTAPGEKVTNCPGGFSWHNFGLAVDVVPDSAQAPDGTFLPDWNTSHPDWQAIVAKATALGLVSGSYWKTFKDWPHLQLTGKFGANPDDEVRQIFKDGGMAAVWADSGLPES